MADTPAPCNQEVFEKGEVAFVMAGKRSADIEEYVQGLAKQTGQQVDWHFVGGRAVVKVLGDVSVVREAAQANQSEGFQFLFN